MRTILKRLIILCRPIFYKFDKIFNYIWYDYPFGKKPFGNKEIYLNLAKNARLIKYPEVENFEKENGFSINQDWLSDLALHTQITVKKSRLCYAHGRVLYSALSNYISKLPDKDKANKINILETGTARGFSALCMAKALQDQKRPGLILTFDNLPHSKKMFWNCIDDLDGPKSRSELLEKWKDLIENYILFHQGDTLIQLKKNYLERINFCFLDGSHTYKDVMFEFNQIKNHQKTGDMIVYDDYTINQFPGIVKAVDEICSNFNYSRKDLKASSNRGYVVATKN